MAQFESLELTPEPIENEELVWTEPQEDPEESLETEEIELTDEEGDAPEQTEA